MELINFIVVLGFNIIWLIQWGSFKNVYDNMLKFNHITPNCLIFFCWLYEVWGVINLIIWLKNVYI